MYQSIYVPVDNSDHSNAAIQWGVALAEAFGARLTGGHVYAAKLHDVRFKQMEFTLPEEYKEETELEKQRRIHDALIARGLQLISDSYLDDMDKRCQARKVALERKLHDGKNFVAIVDDIRASDYDLVVLGALGQGAVRDSSVGSVTERVLRRIEVDTIVVRDLEVGFEGDGAIVVGLDGSPLSYATLDAACTLAAKRDKLVQVVAVRDPQRSEDALLGRHLEAILQEGRSGVRLEGTLLDGRPDEVLAAFAKDRRPWLMAVGSTGLDGDSSADGLELGGLTERLVRSAPCNIWVHGHGRIALEKAS